MIVPYIPQAQREKLDRILDPIVIETEGQLAYGLAKLVTKYTEGRTKVGYTELAAVIGVIDTLKSEYYRQRIADYEDQKKAENGDIAWSG